ncbi:hypothetical protein BX600DRAFT_438876 [Xylariales sp. PMI_506]|nr:hypothetical protein BX600DRAFT_438876 [Xylariales sp. PMI_506]
MDDGAYRPRKRVRRDGPPDRHHSEPKHVKVTTTTEALAARDVAKMSNAEALARLRRLFSLPPQIVTGIERLRSEVGVDVLDMSFLTVVQIGQRVPGLLKEDGSTLVKLANRRRVSFMSFLPARYGHCGYLDDAIRCFSLTSRRAFRHNQQTMDVSEAAQFSKTLKSLQIAVNNSKNWSNPDLICAVMLVAMCELLEPSSAHAWESHIAAISRLIQFRGPHSVITEYEKALWIAVIVPIMVESLRKGESSFLSDPIWDKATKSATVPTQNFSPRGVYTLSIMQSFGRLTRIIDDIRNAVYEKSCTSEGDFNSLHNRTIRFRDSLSCEIVAVELSLAFEKFSVSESNTVDSRHQVRGGLTMMKLVVDCLLVAISNKTFAETEKEISDGVLKIRYLISSLGSDDRWAAFWLKQWVGFIPEFVGTVTTWNTTEYRQANGMIQPERFDLLFKNVAKYIEI